MTAQVIQFRPKPRPPNGWRDDWEAVELTNTVDSGLGINSVVSVDSDGGAPFARLWAAVYDRDGLGTYVEMVNCGCNLFTLTDGPFGEFCMCYGYREGET